MFAWQAAKHWKVIFYLEFFFRKNDWAILKYKLMKYELAEKANQDKKIYSELKELNVNGFIDSMILK